MALISGKWRGANVVSVCLISLTAPACSDPQSPGAQLPPVLKIIGTATGTAAGIEAQCVMDLAVFLQPQLPRHDNGTIEYAASWGGSVHRQVLDENGDGFGFWLHLHDPEVRFRIIRGDSVEIDLDSADPGLPRFYQSLEVIGGRYTNGGRGRGSWNCSPLDIWEGGYVDTTVVAPGTWTMFPEGAEP